MSQPGMHTQRAATASACAHYSAQCARDWAQCTHYAHNPDLQLSIVWVIVHGHYSITLFMDTVQKKKKDPRDLGHHSLLQPTSDRGESSDAI